MFAGAEKGAESFMLQENRRFLSTPGRVRMHATVCVCARACVRLCVCVCVLLQNFLFLGCVPKLRCWKQAVSVSSGYLVGCVAVCTFVSVAQAGSSQLCLISI